MIKDTNSGADYGSDNLAIEIGFFGSSKDDIWHTEEAVSSETVVDMLARITNLHRGLAVSAGIPGIRLTN